MEGFQDPGVTKTDPEIEGFDDPDMTETDPETEDFEDPDMTETDPEIERFLNPLGRSVSRFSPMNTTKAAALNIKGIPANRVLPQSVAAGSIPPTLPPSVEEAYKKKCIELKRRMNEVEESNDAFRLRKIRLMRGIRKMRLERAFLLEILGKRMRKNGSGLNGVHGNYDEDSEGSSEGPPTPLEKPLRSKRSHRRPVPSPPPSLVHLSQPNAVSLGHPTSSFPDFQSPTIPTTNGTSTIRLSSHANLAPVSFAPNSNNNNATTSNANNNLSPTHSTRPAGYPSDFEEFLDTKYFRERQTHPNYPTDELLLNRARQDWADLASADKEEYGARRDRRYQAYQANADEGRGRGRDRDVEGSGRSGSASGGGFTAVNG